MRGRIDEIDFFRGLCIVIMVMVHADYFLPFPLKQIVQLILDAAAEGFVLISGITISFIFFPKMEEHFFAISKKIIIRAFQILGIHYFMMVTIDLPKSLAIDHINLSLTSYLLDMLLLHRLPFLLDILPLFFFLMLSAPLTAYLFFKVNKCAPAFISLALFSFGLYDPYLFSKGHHASFPFIQWQIYFIMGIYIGQYRTQLSQFIEKKRLSIACIFGAFFLILVYLRHAVAFHPPYVTDLLVYMNFRIIKFPLTAWGFIYGIALLGCYFFAFDKLYHQLFYGTRFIKNYLIVIGKNSLFCFVFTYT